MRPRFPLRVLLALPVLVAAACLWVTRPTVVANRFLKVMEAGDFALADQQFSDPDNAIQAKTREVVGNGSFISTRCVLQRATWTDWLLGRRRIYVDIRYAAGPDPPGSTPRSPFVMSALQFQGFQAIATPLQMKPLTRRN